MARRIDVSNSQVGPELSRIMNEIVRQIGKVPYDAIKPMSDVAKRNLEEATPLAPNKQGVPANSRTRRRGSRAKYNLPNSKRYLTEHARDNVKVLIDPKGFTLKFHDDMYYIDFVEHGTARQGAQPFIAESLNSSKSEMLEIIKQKVREGVGRV